MDLRGTARRGRQKLKPFGPRPGSEASGRSDYFGCPLTQRLWRGQGFGGCAYGWVRVLRAEPVLCFKSSSFSFPSFLLMWWLSPRLFSLLECAERRAWPGRADVPTVGQDVLRVGLVPWRRSRVRVGRVFSETQQSISK